jgi:hypothetical protein
VPGQFHGVVKYPAHDKQVRLDAVNKEVAGPADYRCTSAHVIPAQTKVPGPNTGAELWPRKTARPVRLRRHVSKGGDDQALVASPSNIAELLVRPGKDVDDIALRGFGQPIAKHQIGVLVDWAARRPI